MQQLDYPDTASITAFVALADTGSFTAAASRIGRDATLISRRVQSLETHLGIRLVTRTTRRVVLTEAGHAYLRRLRPLLQGLEVAGREAAAFADGEPRGRLRLALPTSFGRLWLAPLIIGFLRKYPEVMIDADYTNRFVDIVGEGYDLAVRVGRLADSRLIARKVANRRRLVCASADYLARHSQIQTPDDLRRHACLCYTGRSDPYLWSFASSEGVQSILVTPRIAADDADVLVQAAIAGLGLVYTTDWHVAPYLADGRLVAVLEEQPIPDEGAVYVMTAATTSPSKTRAFSDWLAGGLSPSPWRRPGK